MDVLGENIEEMALGTVLPAMGTKISTAMIIFIYLFIIRAESIF